jgi:hypothetical protein
MLTLRISVDRDRVGRGKAWIRESGIVERGETAWDWLRRDERGRIVGLVVASVAVSITVSLLATALVRMVESRRSVAAAGFDEEPAGATVAAPAAEPEGAVEVAAAPGEPPADEG